MGPRVGVVTTDDVPVREGVVDAVDELLDVLGEEPAHEHAPVTQHPAPHQVCSQLFRVDLGNAGRPGSIDRGGRRRPDVEAHLAELPKRVVTQLHQTGLDHGMLQRRAFRSQQLERFERSAGRCERVCRHQKGGDFGGQ